MLALVFSINVTHTERRFKSKTSTRCLIGKISLVWSTTIFRNLHRKTFDIAVQRYLLSDSYKVHLKNGSGEHAEWKRIETVSSMTSLILWLQWVWTELLWCLIHKDIINVSDFNVYRSSQPSRDMCPTSTTTLFEWNLKIIMVILISVHFLTKTSPWNECWEQKKGRTRITEHF